MKILLQGEGNVDELLYQCSRHAHRLLFFPQTLQMFFILILLGLYVRSTICCQIETQRPSLLPKWT